MTLIIERVGRIAARLTLVALSRRTMLPLGSSAVVANLFFATQGALARIWPTLARHMLLLPLNGYRRWQMVDHTRRARAAPATEDAFGWIADLQRPERIPTGTCPFAAGDITDRLYYLVSGTVRLREIDRAPAPPAPSSARSPSPPRTFGAPPQPCARRSAPASRSTGRASCRPSDGTPPAGSRACGSSRGA